jgi:hypothetical protein
MLDGRRYLADSSDVESAGEGRVLISAELLETLRAIEKEISQFIRSGAEDAASIVPAVVEGEPEDR